MAVRDQVTINDALEAFLVEQRGRLDKTSDELGHGRHCRFA